MPKPPSPRGARGPGLVDHAISALNAWIGDHLAESGNELEQPMAFYRENRSVAPEDLEAPPTGKVCVLVHGLGYNESSWKDPERGEGEDYGRRLEQQCGHMPLYLRFNTGLRISTNGALLADLLQRFCTRRDAGVSELLLIGHSLGGLVIRSACHRAHELSQDWVTLVRDVVYLGSPHLGAPLERATNAAAHFFGRIDTTATHVLSEVLDSRSAGVRDLRFGNLVDLDWTDRDPDELLHNRRSPVPWLATARHHFVVGRALPAVAAAGDWMVGSDSAAGRASGAQPGPPAGSDVVVMPGLGHLDLARHPAVFEHLERWITSDG